MKPHVKSFVIFASVAWLIGCFIALLIVMKAFDTNAKKAAEAAYQQGYKDALYKRPVSNDLEMVCAGLWIGQEHVKHQQRDK